MAPAANTLAPSAELTTLMIGWESKFTLAWTAEGGDAGSRLIEGRIQSLHGRSAREARLLAQALDRSGAVVDQRIVWIVGGVPALGHASFRIGPMPLADHYRVTVWDYTIQKRG
jgi:hypothetical protein